MKTKMWKRTLASLLAVSMIGGSSAAVYAADFSYKLETAVEAEQENEPQYPQEENLKSEETGNTESETSDKASQEQVEVSENKTPDGEIGDKTEIQEQQGKDSEPNNLQAVPKRTLPNEEVTEKPEGTTQELSDVGINDVIEEYTPLEAGKEVHQTDGQKTSYIFAPAKSGYYRLTGRSVNGQNFVLGTEATFYYTQDENNESVLNKWSNYGSTLFNSEDKNQVMWLNKEEQYVFYCDSWAGSDSLEVYDFELCIDAVGDITGFEVETNPQNPSYDFLDYTGMRVKIQHADGSATLSSVTGADGGRGWCVMESLVMSPGYSVGKFRDSAILLTQVDGDVNWKDNFRNLANGEHTAQLCIWEDLESAKSYEFPITFEKGENKYQKMEIVPSRTVYYAGRDGENLGDSITSNDFQIRFLENGVPTYLQYWYNLPYTGMYGNFGMKIENNDGYYQTIDYFKSSGGSLGEQTVYVDYGGLQASYTITIKENPYYSAEIVENPNKTQFLHNKNQSLELEGMVIRAYKDAAKESYDTFSYDEYITYGQHPDDLTEEEREKYQIMDAWGRLFYYELGGHNGIEYLELGEHDVNVWFMGFELSYKIQVVKQLANRLTIIQEPENAVYYSGYEIGLDLTGMEIEIEDLQGEVKKYQYGRDSSSDESADYGDWWDISQDFTWSFDIDWNTPGDYTAVLSYLGAEASIPIVLVENPVKTFQITKMPDKNTYYQFEDIDVRGMEYSITYKNGETFTGKAEENYPYFSYEGKDFYMSSDWKFKANGKAKLGENVIIFSALGVRTETDKIMVNEDPVQSMSVVKNPEKMQYIGEHGHKIDLYGMELSIVYTDGTNKKVSFTEHTDSLELQEGCGGEITAYFSSDDEQRYLVISYINQTCRIDLPKVDLSKCDPVEMTDETCYSVDLTEDKTYQVYSFIPSETKTYHFFSTGRIDSYVEAYEGNNRIASDDDSGENNNFKFSQELKAGSTYYFIVSEYSGNPGAMTCYFSSTADSLSSVQVTDMKIISIPKDTWYDFESTHIWAEGWNLNGTEYEAVYSNGWRRVEKITEAYGNSMDFSGTMLSVKWEYTTVHEYGDEYVDTGRDNSLIYTFGEKEIGKFPATFNKPSPVESVTVVQHPWENWSPYEYEVFNDNAMSNGAMSVQIKYNDGTPEETVHWDFAEEGSSYSHNGYTISARWKDIDNIQAGKENTVAVTYMGKSADISVMVKEDPVKSIEILQNPEKTEYYPFEERVDLYGAKLQITYTDSKVQTVEAAEHTNWITVPDTNERLYLAVNYDEDDNQDYLYVSYMGYRKKVMPYTIRQFTVENSIRLTEDKTEQVVLKDNTSYQIFSFTPSEDGNYRFGYDNSGGDYYTSIYLYSAAGKYLVGGSYSVEYEMVEGRQYYMALFTDDTAEQNLICSITRQTDTPKEDISEIYFSVNMPKAGESLADISKSEYSEYYVSSYQWLNDAGDDKIADYGTAHRLMIVLQAKSAFQFSSATKVYVNDYRVTAKSTGSDGRMTVYYTFPHTQCRITVPEAAGYTLDESQNAEQGKTNYGGDYKFRYTKNADNTNTSRIIVKANDTVLTPDTDGTYTIERVTENTVVTVKQENLSAGPGESKLTMYNKSSNIFDIMVGKQNARIADNEGSEKTLPSLESYVDGSDQFFFGWYLDKDTGLNGKGERFTSQSILVNPLYDLYARWGKGIFSYILNNKQVNCRILSIDEFNKTKVQIGDAAKAAGAASAEPNARAADENGTLVIPDKIDWNSNEDLKALGITFSDCEVSAIAENTFAGDSTIKNIVLPETLESIGAGAFAGCTGLEKVSIPSSVDTVPQGAFQGCTSLSHVHLEEGVTRIDANAFDGCTNLKTLVLPDTIETVNVTAFESCKDFDIVCSSSMKEFGAVTAIQEATGARVVTVDLELDYEFDEKQFTYGDAAQTFTAKVRVNEEEAPGREIIWTYPITTAYDFQVSTDKNSLTVTPKQATSAADRIIIKASDAESGKARSILLSTIPMELTGVDADQKPLYSIKEIGAQKYTGSEIKPEITVIDNVTKAELPKDAFDVSYTNNIQPGTASVAVSGKGNYTGTLSAQFIIEKEKAAQTITASDITKVYGNASFSISASTDGDGILSYESSDSKIVSVDSATGKAVIKKAGTVDLAIKASETDTYQEAVKTIKITVKKAALKISKKSYKKVYGSKPFKLGVSAKDTVTYTTTNKKIALVKNGKVTIKACGTAKIKVSVKSGNYTNTPQTITINVVPKKAAVKKTASKKAGQMTVTWKKQKEAAGYTIEYSTNKKFKKGVKKVNIGKNKTTSTTIKKKLSKGKKYYVRVKAYTKINKKKVYGSVSKVRQVKIKR